MGMGHRIQKVRIMVNKALLSNATDEWSTPDDFFNKLNEIYKFTLDPCATLANTKCEKFFTVNDDGLSKSWRLHTTFCNPPYSKMKDWVAKCFYESEQLDTKVVMLIPSRTDTKYWHDYVMKANRIIFVKGRLRFGGAKNVAPFPSCVVEFKQNTEMSVPIISAMDR